VAFVYRQNVLLLSVSLLVRTGLVVIRASLIQTLSLPTAKTSVLTLSRPVNYNTVLLMWDLM